MHLQRQQTGLPHCSDKVPPDGCSSRRVSCIDAALHKQIKPAVFLMRVKADKKQNMQLAGSTAAAADSRVNEGRPPEEQHNNGRVQRDGKAEHRASEDGHRSLIDAHGQRQ